MTKFKVAVSDTITFARSCEVEIEAESEDAALDQARTAANDGSYHSLWREEEVDNTPYDVRIV